jgi:uncharacterized protein
MRRSNGPSPQPATNRSLAAAKTSVPAPSCLLAIKAVPVAKRDEIAGWLGDRLKVRVSAPPEQGRANQAIIELFAHELGLKSQQIDIETGHASPLKALRISGMSAQAFEAWKRRVTP